MDCKLRSWRIEDAADLAGAINNTKVLNNLRDGLPYPYTVSDAQGFITAMLAAERDSTFAFAITIDDRAVGSIGVFRQSNIHSKTAEMGYYVAESCWGQGVGTGAIQQMCDFIFENTNIIRIFAEPFAHNLASCRILEKCGFICEGTLRKNAVKNGEVIDMKMYAKIKQ